MLFNLKVVLCTFTEVTPTSILQAFLTFETELSSGTCNTTVAIIVLFYSARKITCKRVKYKIKLVYFSTKKAAIKKLLLK